MSVTSLPPFHSYRGANVVSGAPVSEASRIWKRKSLVTAGKNWTMMVMFPPLSLPTFSHPAPRSSIHSRRSLITSREADGERRLGRRTEPRTRRGEDMRANQGSRIWILQITVYYKELLTVNRQGTNHPRSILSFMDISILYLMVRSLHSFTTGDGESFLHYAHSLL